MNPGGALRPLAAALVALAACTGPSPAARPAGPSGERPSGTVLADQEQDGALVQVPLPEGEPVPLRMPEELDFVPMAFAVPDGAVAMVFSADRTTIYHLSVEEEPRPILRGLTDVTSFRVVGDQVVVGDCRSGVLLVRGIDAGSPTRRVGASCFGALSPDGTRAAYARDDAIWRVPVDGSAAPVRLFGLAEVPGLAPVVPAPGRSVFDMTWGEPGLALTVGDGETTAVVVALNDGSLHAVDTLGALFIPFLSWQPGGDLLGIGSGQSGREGFIRLYDPADASVRTIALHPRGYLGATWSPDGRRVLAVSGAGLLGSNSGAWALLTLDGRQLDPIPEGGGFVFGWLA
jgi:Tol biopolymer transport system component